MRTAITPILLSDLDKKILVELSARLQRNQSDTVRVLIRGALDILRDQDAANIPRPVAMVPQRSGRVVRGNPIATNEPRRSARKLKN